jgi:hypothetical protein
VHGSALQPEARDYRAVLRVVDAAARANTLEAFRMATLEAIARELGYADLTFFVGATVEEAFGDPRPTVLGRAGRMLDQYVGGWWRDDVYARPPAVAMFRRRPAVALRELPRPAGARERRYVEQFLVANRIRGGEAPMLLPARARGRRARRGRSVQPRDRTRAVRRRAHGQEAPHARARRDRLRHPHAARHRVAPGRQTSWISCSSSGASAARAISGVTTSSSATFSTTRLAVSS